MIARRAVEERGAMWPGTVIVSDDGRVLRVQLDGELVAIVRGAHPNGEMSTEPTATRRPS